MAEPNDQVTPFPLLLASLAEVEASVLLLLEDQDAGKE